MTKSINKVELITAYGTTNFMVPITRDWLYLDIGTWDDKKGAEVKHYVLEINHATGKIEIKDLGE